MIKLSINFFKQTVKTEINKNNGNANASIMEDFQNAGNKIFSAADLWNIQRKGRSAIQRRWSF